MNLTDGGEHVAAAERAMSAGVDLLKMQVQAEERELMRQLGAPIFAQLMVIHQLNPLGIVVNRSDDVDLRSPTGDTILRIESMVSWVITRPRLKPLV